MRTIFNCFLVLAVSGCGTQPKITMLGPPDQKYDPVPLEDVWVFASADRVRAKHQPIARIDVSVDPDPNLWIPFFPTDGIFDEATESFDLDVSSLISGGSRLVAVRATDSAGNQVVRTVEVR